jgi:hypothetical protein
VLRNVIELARGHINGRDTIIVELACRHRTADAMAIACAGWANAAPLNVENHAGESITGDLMTKAW